MTGQSKARKPRKARARPVPQAYSITDTAVLLNRGRDVVYALIESKALVTVPIGKRDMVTAESIRELLGVDELDLRTVDYLGAERQTGHASSGPAGPGTVATADPDEPVAAASR